jgi:hypothetical protein
MSHSKLESAMSCFVCGRVTSLNPKGEMDGGTMFLRGFLQGLYLGVDCDRAVDRLLHGGILCSTHLEQAAIGIDVLSVVSKSGPLQ